MSSSSSICDLLFFPSPAVVMRQRCKARRTKRLCTLKRWLSFSLSLSLPALSLITRPHAHWHDWPHQPFYYYPFFPFSLLFFIPTLCASRFSRKTHREREGPSRHGSAQRHSRSIRRRVCCFVIWRNGLDWEGPPFLACLFLSFFPPSFFFFFFFSFGLIMRVGGDVVVYPYALS